MVLFVLPQLRRHVRESLNHFIHVPFRFEFSGSQLIFYDPQEDLSEFENERDNLPIARFQELDPPDFPDTDIMNIGGDSASDYKDVDKITS